jgi:hypothetical protein
MKDLRAALVVIGIVLYATAFYTEPLSNLRAPDGSELRRSDLLVVNACHVGELAASSWFGSPPQFTVADRAPVAIGAGLLLAWAAAAGRLLLRLGRMDLGLTRLEVFIFSTAVGLNVLSTWMLVMGLLGRMNRFEVVVLPISATCLIAATAWCCRRGNREHAPSPATETTTAAPLADEQLAPWTVFFSGAVTFHWLWLAAPFVLAILLTAMLPATDFDVCGYHLQAPKEFLQEGRIVFLPHNVYANMPMGSEMLSLLAMVGMGDWWWGALVAKTVLAAFTPLCAAAVFAAGRRLHSLAAGSIGALVYISIPWVVCLSPSGLVECVLACYTFLAIYALLLPNATDREPSDHPRTQPPREEIKWRGPSPRHIVLSGYLVGCAIATKYPAVLFLLIPLTAWLALFELVRGRASQGRWLPAFRTAAGPTIIFVLAIIGGGGLWYGKSWATTGNPTYPLLYDVFGGRSWSAEKDRQWTAAHHPSDFSAAAFGNEMLGVLLTSEGLSPLLAPLGVLAFCGQKKPRFAWALLFYLLFVLLAWWLTAPRVDRFWMPILPLWALLAGIGACWSSARWWRKFLVGFMLLGLATNFLLVAFGPENAWFIPLAQLRNSDKPHWVSPWHRYLNNAADCGAVLSVGDQAVFDLKPKVYYNTCFDDCLFEQWVRDRTPADIRRELDSRGIRYVLVDWEQVAQFRETFGFSDFVKPEVFNRLEEQGILVRLRSGEECPQRLYRVAGGPAELQKP